MPTTPQSQSEKYTGIFLVPKLSDLKAVIAASGGRKARPYKRLVHPSGRGGVYPRPQATIVANPRSEESLNLGTCKYKA